MKKYIYLLILLTLNFACSLVNDKVESFNKDFKTDTINTSQIDSLESEIDNSIERDSLVFSWDDDLINLTKSELGFRSTKKAKANNHVEGQIDTIEVFNFKNSNIKIYHAKNKDILVSADIRNSELEISKGVRVGINRNELHRILNTTSRKDTIDVTDSEGNTDVKLFLSDNILRRILYCAYVE